jgi:hypothetical protein
VPLYRPTAIAIGSDLLPAIKWQSYAKRFAGEFVHGVLKEIGRNVVKEHKLSLPL